MKKNSEFYDISVVDYKGNMIKMKEFEGYALIIVNVASKCGLAEQNYRDLSTIADIFYDDGLRILIFPCNEFLNQEPLAIKKIAELALDINDKFIVFDKINVLEKGLFRYVVSKSEGEQHDLFKYLTSSITNGWMGKQIKWNFTKFLIDKNGYTKYRYGPNDSIKSDDVELLKALNINKNKN